MNKAWLTIPQLAREMNLSRIEVYRKVKAGQIPAQRIGRNYAISKNQAEALLKKVKGPTDTEWLDRAVKKVVAEYGELLKWLSKE